MVIMLLSGGFLGLKTSVVFGSEETPKVKVLAERGSLPQEALNAIPEKVKNKIKTPKSLPFNGKGVKNSAQSQQFGEEKYYFEEYWENNDRYFFFNVLNGTPKIDENFKDDPNFSFQTVEIYDGIKATYIAGPTSEKLFWNDNGFQYMIGDNSKNGKSDFYGPTKLAETALSFQ